METINGKDFGLVIAETIYSKYCEEVGGVAFNGDPLPDWKTFYATESKQAKAWKAVGDLVAFKLGATLDEHERLIRAKYEKA